MANIGFNMYDKETIAVYNNKVADYVRLVDRPPSIFLIDFIKRVKLNGNVLDLGCGPGNSTAEMKRCGLKPYAIDASSEMIKKVKKRYNLRPRKVAEEIQEEICNSSPSTSKVPSKKCSD